MIALAVLLRTARAASVQLTTSMSSRPRDSDSLNGGQQDFDSQLVVGLDAELKYRVHKRLSAQFPFLVDDYRSACYWYEPGVNIICVYDLIVLFVFTIDHLRCAYVPQSI